MLALSVLDAASTLDIIYLDRILDYDAPICDDECMNPDDAIQFLLDQIANERDPEMRSDMLDEIDLIISNNPDQNLANLIEL